MGNQNFRLTHYQAIESGLTDRLTETAGSRCWRGASTGPVLFDADEGRVDRCDQTGHVGGCKSISLCTGGDDFDDVLLGRHASSWLVFAHTAIAGSVHARGGEFRRLTGCSAKVGYVTELAHRNKNAL